MRFIHCSVRGQLKRFVEKKRIIIVGHSLGSGVAAHLSASLSIKGTPPGGLILLSAYASIPGIFLFLIQKMQL